MASAELEVVNELLRSFSLAGLTLAEQRSVLEQTASAPLAGTLVEGVDADGITAEWVTAPGATSQRVLMSLHGGAYSLGSLNTNRWFSSVLSFVAGQPVLSIDYRLAPEHRFPAAVDDAVAAYQWMLSCGFPATNIAIVGNSAGGGLALATLVALRDLGIALPYAAVGLSPWTDLTASGESVTACAHTDLMLSGAGLRSSAALYTDPAQHDHPYASPLFADLRGVPPILLQASRAEILRDDTTRFVERAHQHGVDVTAQLYDDMPHVWHMFYGLLPEANEALEHMGRWLVGWSERAR